MSERTTKNDCPVVQKTISQEQLQKLYDEHEMMQLQIKKLNTCLINYEKKWSKIVKNVIRENADLKFQNEKMKKKMVNLKTSHTISSEEDEKKRA